MLTKELHISEVVSISKFLSVTTAKPGALTILFVTVFVGKSKLDLRGYDMKPFELMEFKVHLI